MGLVISLRHFIQKLRHPCLNFKKQNNILEKTKSVVRQGRKTTGFNEAAGLPNMVARLFLFKKINRGQNENPHNDFH